MALDGIVIANMAHELSTKLTGGRINKIAQPEKDELLLTIKNERQTYRLFVSADASLPLIYLTDSNKPSPMTAPNFCMLLRKHLNSAKIISVSQPGLERILTFEIEHLNELGDVCRKYLIIEIMGKHSNIIFCDDQYKIIDSIKHISGFISSVREVLPGRDYFIPNTLDKRNPLETDFDTFCQNIYNKPTTLSKAIYTTYTGISPLIANEICTRSSLDADISATALNETEQLHVYHMFALMMDSIKEHDYQPMIIYRDEEPIEFSSLDLTCYDNLNKEPYDSISVILESYYALKNQITRIRQKSSDLRRIVATAIERTSKKYDLQQRQLKDTEKREKYKIYGELLHTYGYQAEPEASSLTCENYYTGKDITIPLDKDLTAMENAKKYFDRYNKLKRTFDALSLQTIETREEMEHLDSIRIALDIATSEDDLWQVKKELTDYGYIRKHFTQEKGQKKKKLNNQPLHYVSSDGFHMYVGKNNFQNEELTFKVANGGDWWFHAKGIPGSHVIVKTEGVQEMPDRTYEEAAQLAAYYSKGKDMDKVEIDYIQRKHIKKPNNAKPGFVIYHTNYSMIISPDIRHIQCISE